jgi:hypothetical protein
MGPESVFEIFIGKRSRLLLSGKRTMNPPVTYDTRQLLHGRIDGERLQVWLSV